MLLYELCNVLFATCSSQSEIPARTAESAGRIVIAIFRSSLHSPPPLLSLTLMTLPAVDPDPDPTTQIPWPGARKRSDRDPDDSRVSSPPANPTNNSSRHPSVCSKADANGKRRRLSTLDLFNLSISMAGAQIAWTVELG